MTFDAKDQVRRYAEHVDSMFAEWTVEEITSIDLADDTPLRVPRWKPIAVVATAFVTVLLAIGLVGLVFRADDPEVVDRPPTSTSSVPSTTLEASTTTTSVPPPSTGQPTTTVADTALPGDDPGAIPAGTWSSFAIDDSDFPPNHVWSWAQRVTYRSGIGFVAVVPYNDSQLGSMVFVSQDGENWARGESPLHGLEGTTLVPTPAGLLAAGLSCRGPDNADCRVAMWSSTDGFAWAERAVDPDVFRDCVGVRPIEACGLQVRVGADASGLLAAGFDRGTALYTVTVWRSDDGATWERLAEVDLSHPDVSQAVEVSHVVKTPSGWLMVLAGYWGDESGLYARGMLLLSPDGGETWQPIDTGDLFEDSMVNDIVVGAGGILAVGTSGECGRPAAWHSIDGVEWTRTALGPEGSRCSYPDVYVASSSSGYLVGQADAMVWWSADGLGWTEVEVDALDGVTWMDLASDGTEIVATGYVDWDRGPWGFWTWSPAD